MQSAHFPIDGATSVKPWFKQKWPWLLMLGPAVVVVAGTFTGYLAFTRQDAMVVDDYYVKGKAINQDLRRDTAATALGLAVKLRYDAANGKLNGTMTSFGKPHADLILVHLAHATRPEKDLNLTVQSDQRGEFSVALPMLERARWEVSVESVQRAWRLAGVWKWPAQPTLDIKADLPPAD